MLVRLEDIGGAVMWRKLERRRVVLGRQQDRRGVVVWKQLDSGGVVVWRDRIIRGSQ